MNREEEVAELIVDHSLGIREGEYICICGRIQGGPLMKEIFKGVLNEGAVPYFSNIITDNRRYENLLKTQYGIDADLPESSIFDLKPPDANIIFTEHTGHTYGRKNLDSEARKVLVGYPTERAERCSGICLDELKNIFYSACLTDYEELKRRGRDVKYLFDQGEEVKIEGKNTELFLRLDGKGTNSYGKVNLPEGEVFYEDPKNVEGTIYFDWVPSDEELAKDVEIKFKAGEIVDYTDSQNLLASLLEEARTVGEFGIGTNSKVEKFTSLSSIDEKMIGTIHMGLESDVKENNDGRYHIHWDVVKDLRDGKIWLDRVLVQDEGKFLFESRNV